MSEPLDLDAITAYCDAATPAPWAVGAQGRREDNVFAARARTDLPLAVAELRRARERNEALEAVLAAAGVTGWLTAPDGAVEPQYDTDDEEDPRTDDAQLTALRKAAAPFVAWARVAVSGLEDIPYRQDQDVVVVTVPFEVRITLGDLRALLEAYGER